MTVLDVLEDGGLALCAGADGTRVEVLTGVVGSVAAGDTLLVHAGAALVRLDPMAGRAP